MKLYIGNYVAREGDFYWGSRDHDGCYIASIYGCEIDDDTYDYADAKVSQFVDYENIGCNDTAIIAMECKRPTKAQSAPYRPPTRKGIKK